MKTDKQLDGALRSLFDNIRFPEEPAGLYDPLRYMIRIGGKRIRPQLCQLAYALFRKADDARTPIPESVLAPAEALEVFHSFTLIHDDIMDRSPLRRGEPTVWKRWNPDTAILSGDVMLIEAYKRMAKAPASVLDDVLELFSRTAAQVCEGQQYDLEFESREDVTMAEYEQMIGLKTAVLLACSAQTGALLAGAPEDACRAMYDYGYSLGMAFQVADDYLDAFGDQKVFGKPIGGDILNAKKSWLTIHALEKAAQADRKGGDTERRFRAAFSAPATDEVGKAAKVEAVCALYRELGVHDDACAEILRYTARGLEAVEKIRLGPVRLQMLRRFADRLTGRAK